MLSALCTGNVTSGYRLVVLEPELWQCLEARANEAWLARAGVGARPIQLARLTHVIVRAGGHSSHAIARQGNVGEGTLTSKSLRRTLGISGQRFQLELDLTDFVPVKVVPASMRPFPKPGRAPVHPDTLRDMYLPATGNRLRRDRTAVATVSFPSQDLACGITLQEDSSVPPGKIALTMALRTLFQVSKGDTAVISPPVIVPETRPHSWVKSAKRWLVLRPIETADLVSEVILRFLLRSPSLAVRTIQMEPGADDESRIRLHPVALDLLGIQSGDQVFVSWGWGQRAAVALLGHDESDPEARTAVRHSQAADTAEQDDPHVPSTLLARLSLPARIGSGLPPHTVVTVRRRLRPLVGRHINLLSVPLVGVLLAAASIQGIRGWQIAVVAAGAGFLALRPLRKSRARSDLWPWS